MQVGEFFGELELACQLGFIPDQFQVAGRLSGRHRWLGVLGITQPLDKSATDKVTKSIFIIGVLYRDSGGRGRTKESFDFL